MRGEVLGCRAPDTPFQLVLRHVFSVGVLIPDEVGTAHHLVCAEAWGCRFRPVPALCLLFLFLLPALTLHYRHYGGMDVRCFLVHVQDCRHEVVRPVGLSQPRHAVIAPLSEPPFVFHSFHILVRSAQHDADCLYLVLPYLAFQPCRVKAVAYGSRAVAHTVGKPDASITGSVVCVDERNTRVVKTGIKKTAEKPWRRQCSGRSLSPI